MVELYDKDLFDSQIIPTISYLMSVEVYKAQELKKRVHRKTSFDRLLQYVVLLFIRNFSPTVP